MGLTGMFPTRGPKRWRGKMPATKEGQGLPPKLVGGAAGYLQKSSMDNTLSSGSWAMSELQQAEADLILTLGVVGRVLHILSSDYITEMKSLPLDEDLDKYVHEAKTIVSHICASFQDNRKGFFRMSEVENFILSLRRRAYDIEDILDKAATNHLEEKGIRARSTGLYSGLRNFIPSLKRRKAYNIKSILDKAATNHLEGEGIPDLNSGVRFIISDLEDICRLTMGKMSGKQSYIPPVLLSNASSHYDRLLSSWEDQIIDRESKQHQLLDWIFNPSNHHQRPNLILITGDSGIGKTSLAKLIYNDAIVYTSFDFLLWVSLKSTIFIPPEEKLKDTIARIIRSFTRQSWCYLQGMDMETLKHILRHILADQKYLLVLDDVNNFDLPEWEKLTKLLKVGSMGSTVVVTSSSGYWDHKMVGVANSLELKGLGEAGSWQLFSRCSKFDEEAEQEYPFLSHIGQDIVDKCRGNPGAIKTLGSRLRTNRDEHMWNQINESMLSFCLQSMSLELVQCFCVYAIISEHKALSRNELVYFWMAQGLLDSRETNDEDLRDIGHRYCNELLSKSFIQPYQIDDHSRLFVNAALENLLTSIKDEEAIHHLGFPFADSGRHLISYMDIDFFRLDRIAQPNLRTFLFGRWVGPVERGLLERLIFHLSHARVLLLDGSLFVELPESIGNLKLLRYLSLKGNHKLQLLPETICNLLNLQTLD